MIDLVHESVVNYTVQGAYKLSEYFAKMNMTDASSVTKLLIPHCDRRLRRNTTSKLPSERALNRHKFQDTLTTLGR
jgi:hypothetical protein